MEVQLYDPCSRSQPPLIVDPPLCSTLLFAAYSVAVSASDSEYFAEICRDIAQSLESETGRAACEAQDEVLRTCDRLFLANKITENQLLYLRHLVLIREEAVAKVYDQYQDSQQVAHLAKSLYELANTHPYESSGSGKDKLMGLFGSRVVPQQPIRKSIRAATEQPKKLLEGKLPPPSKSQHARPQIQRNEEEDYDDEEDEEEDDEEEEEDRRPVTRPASRTQLESSQSMRKATAAAASMVLKSEMGKKLPTKQHPNLSRAGYPSEISQLRTVAAIMVRNGEASAKEGAVLVEMVRNGNEYITAAFELYRQDGDLDDLKDTIIRFDLLQLLHCTLSLPHRHPSRHHCRHWHCECQCQWAQSFSSRRGCSPSVAITTA